MSRLYSRFFQLQISIGLLVGFASSAHAAGWFDDFNDGSTTDGNPVSWLENLGGSPFFPGRYDASSGDYVLDPDDFNSPTGQMSALVPAVSFTNTYMRAQGMVLPDPDLPDLDDANLVLTARINPATLTGYLVYFDSGGGLQLQILEPGGAGVTTRDIGTSVDATFDARSEVVVELNVVGDQLSAYAWLADDPNGKPEVPQATATDSTYASGIAGLAFDEDDPGTSVVFRYATAQDTPFVDAVAGDFNGDGKVDAADYVVWRKGAQSQDDYDAWRMNFGIGTGSGSLAGSAVPEPAALVHVVVAIAAFLASAVRRRSVLG